MLEETHKGRFVWKGFFIGSKRKEGASLQWIKQQRKRAH
jgi:hypothetical protein